MHLGSDCTISAADNFAMLVGGDVRIITCKVIQLQHAHAQCMAISKKSTS